MNPSNSLAGRTSAIDTILGQTTLSQKLKYRLPDKQEVKNRSIPAKNFRFVKER